jgi:hypothetical protein
MEGAFERVASHNCSVDSLLDFVYAHVQYVSVDLSKNHLPKHCPQEDLRNQGCQY